MQITLLPPPPTQPKPLNPTNNHNMQTLSKENIFKPNPKYSLLTISSLPTSLEPTTDSQALKLPEWRHAMNDEFNALLRNETWDLIPPDSSHNLVSCKSVFRIKHNPNDSIDHYNSSCSKRVSSTT